VTFDQVLGRADDGALVGRVGLARPSSEKIGQRLPVVVSSQHDRLVLAQGRADVGDRRRAVRCEVETGDVGDDHRPGLKPSLRFHSVGSMRTPLTFAVIARDRSAFVVRSGSLSRW
jgi:hypothetical protein